MRLDFPHASTNMKNHERLNVEENVRIHLCSIKADMKRGLRNCKAIPVVTNFFPLMVCKSFFLFIEVCNWCYYIIVSSLLFLSKLIYMLLKSQFWPLIPCLLKEAAHTNKSDSFKDQNSLRPESWKSPTLDSSHGHSQCWHKKTWCAKRGWTWASGSLRLRSPSRGFPSIALSLNPAAELGATSSKSQKNNM